MSELQCLETKCDRITTELSEVKKLITSLPPGIGVLIDSIEHSANEMYEQSVRHRQYVEQCIGKSTLRLIGRADDGL